MQPEPTTFFTPTRRSLFEPEGNGLAEGIAAMLREEENRRRQINDAVVNSLGFLSHLENIPGMPNRDNFEEEGISQQGGISRVRHLSNHPEREEASSGITRIINTAVFGIGALFLYSSAEERKEIEDNVKILSDDKLAWENLLWPYFRPSYHIRVKDLFQKAIVFLKEKEKNLLANYYLRVTLLSSAILTGISIALKAHLFYQITAAVICAAASFFVIRRYAQGSYFEEVRLSVELINQVQAARREFNDNLLSMEAISDILDA